MKLLKCQSCSSDTVLADAGVLNNIPYHYCRTCKIEVDSEGFEVLPEMEDWEEIEFNISNKRTITLPEGAYIDLKEFRGVPSTALSLKDYMDFLFPKHTYDGDPGDEDESVNPNFLPSWY